MIPALWVLPLCSIPFSITFSGVRRALSLAHGDWPHSGYMVLFVHGIKSGRKKTS